MSAGATALLTGIDEMRRTPSSRDMRMIGEPRRWEAARLGWFDHHHDAVPGLVSCAGWIALWIRDHGRSQSSGLSMA